MNFYCKKHLLHFYILFNYKEVDKQAQLINLRLIKATVSVIKRDYENWNS